MSWRADARRMPSSLVSAAAVALAMWTAGPAPAAAADDGVIVRVDAVRREPLAQTVPVIGRLVALRRGVVAVREPGIVAYLAIEVGDRVKRGDVVARLLADRLVADRDLRTAEIAEARAGLAAAEAERQLRRQELARIEGLRRSPAYTEGRYEDKRQDVAIAEGRVAAAEAAEVHARAQLRLTEIAIKDSEIRAPYDGVVTQRMTEVGAHVGVGDPVIGLIDDLALEIEADVPADRIAGLTHGRTVEFDLGDRRLTAEVRAVVPDENPLTRTRTVRLTPSFGDVTDRAANRSVTLHVPAAASRAVATVHKDAVLHDADGNYVMRVVDGKAERRLVRLGEANGIRFEVLDGLSPGDVVVIRGNERLESGQRVRRAEGDTG
jgi:RND family efflux transporter MFP subunit